MQPRISSLLLLGLLFAGSEPLAACLWDRDTLAMERERFPDVIELITGKFLRHSRHYYEWRVEECKAIIEAGQEKPGTWDDLAVAYEKLGNHDKAIETILKKEEKFPGLYETYANLGTFYIHKGEHEKGIEQIDRAIAINPDAHFGREVYQKLLVQYVLSKQVDGKTQLPLDTYPQYGFAKYVLTQKKLGHDDNQNAAELEKAQKGIMGMMRFGNHDSPVLLEALASLLIGRHEGNLDNAKRLATCALLKASLESQDETVRQAYREMASRALDLQTKGLDSRDQLPLEELEVVFKIQIAEGEEWYAELEANEISWIQAGKNPDDEFARKYHEKPAVSRKHDGPKPSRFELFLRSNYGQLLLIVLVVLGGIGVFGFIVFWWARWFAKSGRVSRVTPRPPNEEDDQPHAP